MLLSHDVCEPETEEALAWSHSTQALSRDRFCPVGARPRGWGGDREKYRQTVQNRAQILEKEFFNMVEFCPVLHLQSLALFLQMMGTEGRGS